MNRYFGVHVLDGEWHALLPRYLVLADRIDGKRVLDIGCGTGIGSSLLLELGAERVDGVDYRPGVLDLANIKHAKESLTFHMMMWENLDFPDGTFDVVVCLDPTTPVTDPNLLAEVSRVLADDGEYVCAIERRTIEGFETLLPRYGYSAPAENVELGQREEQAPQIGELTHHFDKLVRVLQRPEYSYVFENEQGNEEGAGEQRERPVDYTLCTEDSHIAGVELIYCGPESMADPENTAVRLPYYRLAERLNTVIRDLNVRQGPGTEGSPLEAPVDSGLGDETSLESGGGDPVGEWEEDTPTNVQERPDDLDESKARDSDAFEGELDQLTGAYRQLRQNFEQLREQTQAAMVAQERSIDQLVQLLRQSHREGKPGWSEDAETDIYDAEAAREAALSEPSEGEGASESELEELRAELEERDSRIEELREKIDELDDSAETSSEEDLDEESEPGEENGSPENSSEDDEETSDD